MAGSIRLHQHVDRDVAGEIVNLRRFSLRLERSDSFSDLLVHLKLRSDFSPEKAATLYKEKEMQGLKAQLEEEEVSQQKTATNDKLSNHNAALKDCMQQLSSVRDVKARTSSDTSKKLASLSADNSHQMKEKLIAELTDLRSQSEAEFNALMARSDSIEKENAFLKYEFMVLAKDLDLRNQEIEFARRSADSSEKNYL